MRPEYSGPEDLDRVLVHLREARERAALKTKNARRSAKPTEEKLSFEHAPSAEPQLHSDEEAAPPSASAPETEPPAEQLASPTGAAAEAAPDDTASASDPGARDSGSRDSDSRDSGAAAHVTPSEDLAAMARATARLERAGRQDVAETTPTPPPAPSIAPPASHQSEDLVARATAGKGELRRAVRQSLPAFRALALFSFTINILMLAGPLFMLQVYDRVMTSHSIPTLLALLALTAATYVVIGLLELVRSRVIARIGVDLDRRTSERVFAAALQRAIAEPGSSMHALRELDQLRQFIAGPGPLTFFDTPWTPVYLIVIFLTHWTLGVVATFGVVLLLLIAWMSEARSSGPLAEASKVAHRSLELAENGERNAEAVAAMGMLGDYRARWQTVNREALAWQVLAADRLSGLSSFSRTLRLLLQSVMLAIGAALAVKGDISSGAIIASTIIFGRALVPVEQIVAHWRNYVRARESFAKLANLLEAYPEPPRRTTLPPLQGHIEARALRVNAPSDSTTILSGISFAVEPGQVVAVIGPSGSGKSTLVRALVGLWPTAGGEIRVDGARLDQWNADEFGRQIGYLPQSVELFSGSVRENIARFDAAASDASVIEAARAAHAHDMIMALPKGYDTELGAFGAHLSAGQRQRIGLARALYGDPALVVLDEPNANLDRAGDEALSAAIDGMRARNRAIVLVSHRVQAINKADRLLFLDHGLQRAFGPRDDVMRFLRQNAGQAPGEDLRRNRPDSAGSGQPPRRQQP